jgi:molecular chaperone GrpE (heat shock protein)
MIQDRLEYDAVKEEAFDKLYEEMKRLKEQTDILDRNIRPLLSDLLLLYDSMKKYEALLKQKVQNSDDTISGLKYLVDELMEILYRQEVVPMEADFSGKFNSKIQKAIKTENSYAEEEDFKITSITRAGFFWRDKVLRPQEVIIKRFINKQQ